MSDRVEKLKSFLVLSPDDCFLNHALALEYIKADNDLEAIILFEKNLSFATDYIATYYHLGKLLERIGERDKAINIYEQGMEVCKKQNEMHTYSELHAAYEDLVY